MGAGQERGEVKADLDLAATGEMLTSTMFGLAVLGRAGFPRKTLDGIVDTTLGALTD